MRGERLLLRLGEFLVASACVRLPQEVREERCREWAAELPAILHDPQVRPAPRRAARMLAYAADTLRSTALAPGRARGRTPRPATVIILFVVACLASVAWDIWAIARAPGHGPGYMQLTWSVLLVAYLLSQQAGPAKRMTALLYTGATLAGLALNLWNAAEAPGDWLDYFFAAILFLVLLTQWRRGRQVRTKRA
jgi:hypothetical protein